MLSNDEIITFISTQHMPKYPLTEKATLEKQDVTDDNYMFSNWSYSMSLKDWYIANSHQDILAYKMTQ